MELSERILSLQKASKTAMPTLDPERAQSINPLLPGSRSERDIDSRSAGESF